jgi:hypothetical protein
MLDLERGLADSECQCLPFWMSNRLGLDQAFVGAFVRLRTYAPQTCAIQARGQLVTWFQFGLRGIFSKGCSSQLMRFWLWKDVGNACGLLLSCSRSLSSYDLGSSVRKSRSSFSNSF